MKYNINTNTNWIIGCCSKWLPEHDTGFELKIDSKPGDYSSVEITCCTPLVLCMSKTHASTPQTVLHLKSVDLQWIDIMEMLALTDWKKEDIVVS